MIVEDDPMLVEIYERKMHDSGYEVRVVTNGSTVVSEAQSWEPDMILLDIVLPDMDGFEIIEALKKDPKIKDVPVYVFSNLSAKEDAQRAMSLGAAGYLTKSNFTPSQLIEEIRKIINHIAPEQPIASPQVSLPVETPPLPPKKEANGQKVLIIEDEDIFIEMFGDKLKQEGFEVVSAKNGRWGLKEAEKGGFSCILLDMMMPAMNGYDAIKELRANDKTKNVPIIILSNSALDSEVKQALELGANAYHVKTQITPGKVAEEVKKLISETKP